VRLAQQLIRQLLIGGSRSATIASNYLVAYSVTEGAIEVLGRTMAGILGPRGITVNTVTPGITGTDLVAGVCGARRSGGHRAHDGVGPARRTGRHRRRRRLSRLRRRRLDHRRGH